MTTKPRTDRQTAASGPQVSGGTLLAVAAYERLRAAIVRGEYRPREALIEADLEQRLEVGRTPIRECMQRLASEGLVVRRRRGWAVHEHTPEEIRELYEVRAGVEGFAARLAATRASDATIQAIRDLHAADDRFAHSPRQQLVEVNDRYHAALAAAAGNQKLIEAIQRSQEHFFSYRVLYLFSDEEAENALAGHARTIQALLARDADAAEYCAREHVLESVEVVLTKMVF